MLFRAHWSQNPQVSGIFIWLTWTWHIPVTRRFTLLFQGWIWKPVPFPSSMGKKFALLPHQVSTALCLYRPGLVGVDTAGEAFLTSAPAHPKGNTYHHCHLEAVLDSHQWYLVPRTLTKRYFLGLQKQPDQTYQTQCLKWQNSETSVKLDASHLE